MGFFDWFKRRAKPMPAPAPAAAPPVPASAPEPEDQWRVGCEQDLLWVADPEGTRRQVAISQLLAIAIETSDGDAEGLGAWWLFYGPDEDVAFTLPLGAHGEGVMVERVAMLPGFRHEAYAEAVRATDVDAFVIWQRPLD